MATPTLTLPPAVRLTFGTERTNTAKVLEASFGDGYVQRAGDGLNNVQSKISVSMTNLTWAEAQSVLAFFEGAAGYRQFAYQSAWDPTPRLYVCKEWHDTPVSGNVVTITATWQQVFN